MLYIHTYLHSFEKQFHVTYSRIYTFIGKAIFMLHIHWKGNFCTTYSWERQFLYYLFTFLKGNFMSYVPILRSIFVPLLTYMQQ